MRPSLSIAFLATLMAVLMAVGVLGGCGGETTPTPLPPPTAAAPTAAAPTADTSPLEAPASPLEAPASPLE
ncbi:MAG: peptidoglycan-binding protein, partial [Caldilinea sp.]